MVSIPQVLVNKRKPPAWLLGLLGAGVILGLSGTYVVSQRGSSDIDLSQLTVPVESESLIPRIDASGTLVAAQSVNLSPKVAGIVAQLLVEQGDQVEKGQVIARMDRRDLEGQIIQARASVAQAQARLAELRAGNRVEEVAQAQARTSQAEAELARRRDRRPEAVAEASSQVAAAESMAKLAQKRVERYQGLAEAGAETRDRVDEVLADNQNTQAALREARLRLLRVQNETEREVQQAAASVQEAQQAFRLSQQGTRPEEIAQAAAAVREAEGRLKVIENQLLDTTIRAPFSGTITQSFTSEGAFVTPSVSGSTNSSSTFASIVAIANELEVKAQVPEIDIGRVRPGQEVEIRADAYPENIFKGRVRLISPEALEEDNVTSLEVRLSLVTGQNKLLSGMNANLVFLGDRVDDALVVPTVAIATQKGKTGVYLPGEDDKPEFTPVTIGTSVAEKTQILDGVDPGERVFIDFPEGIQPEGSEEE